MEGLALFGTPVFTFPDLGERAFDKELVRRLVLESESAAGVKRSNSGGWHSVPDLTEREEPCYQDLIRRIIGSVRGAFNEITGTKAAAEMRYRYVVQAWAMVMRHGDHVIVHDHPGSHFSVVYYPDAGDADMTTHPDSGRLTFIDPRRGGTVIGGVDLFPSLFSVEAHDGLLVVFPGWLQHFVQPYRGGRPRVSISCNVRFEPEPT